MVVKTNKTDVISNFIRYYGRQPSSTEDLKTVEYLTTKAPQEVESLLAKNSPITKGKLWGDYQKTKTPITPTAPVAPITPIQPKKETLQEMSIRLAKEEKAKAPISSAPTQAPAQSQWEAGGNAGVAPFSSPAASAGAVDDSKVAGGTTNSEVADEFSIFINNDPFITEQFKDANIKAKFDKLPKELKLAYIQSMQSLGNSIEAGKVVNPNISITPAQAKEFTDQAFTELDPYYQEQIKLYKQDLDTSISRLQQDFDKGIRSAEEPFKENLAAQAESEAQAGLTYGSERVKREGQAVQDQQQKIEDYTTTAQRNAEDIAKTGERKLGSDLMGKVAMPTLGNYQVSNKGFSQTGSRNLSSALTGGLIGEMPKAETVALTGRSSDLEDAYRKQRILSLSPLS